MRHVALQASDAHSYWATRAIGGMPGPSIELS
jgi:hypothetical protein